MFSKAPAKFHATFLALALAGIGIAFDLHRPSPSQPAPVILVASLDTAPSHFRNGVVRRFGQRLAELSDGGLLLEIYEAGQLMSDRDVGKALAWGLIDFAMPADSKVARFEPNASLLSLPAFYGRPPEIAYAVTDGPLGGAVRAAIEETLNVRVLAPLLDLGFTATYATERPLRGSADYVGLKLRYPGGVGPALLFAELGAVPVAVPFPDVPLALSQGSLDALQSTHETMRSARLWDAGIKHCLEDNANLIQYVPMVSNAALRRLRADQQALLFTAWRQLAEPSRALAQRIQAEARADLASAGVHCRALPHSRDPALRQRLNDASRTVAAKIGMDVDLLEGALVALAQRP